MTICILFLHKKLGQSEASPLSLLKGLSILSIVLFCLFVSYVAFAENGIQSYPERLNSEGKERVIVSFKDEIDPSIVTKYNCKIIRAIKTIKALVCEIPKENIELLEKEEAIKYVAIDAIIQAQPGGEDRDPYEYGLFLGFKDEYFSRIDQEYNTSIIEARNEYITFIQTSLLRQRKIIELYSRLLSYYRNRHLTRTYFYRWLLSKYQELLKRYYQDLMRAFQEYRQKLIVAREAYGQASSIWEEKVNEMVALSYRGPVTVRWNNLEAGLNSKAAWDRYGLDGTGIRIAFLDTGVNYNLENLGGGIGLGFKCLDGYDFWNDDDDPINDTPEETHGTNVVSVAVGKGVNKVVGVAYNVSYYAVKCGESDGAWSSDIMAGIEWASTEPHKADIISISWTIYTLDPWLKEHFEEICNNAYNQGIIIVAGSGNNGYSYSGWPAAFDNVISVGAHAEDQTLYNYAGYSTNGGVDVIAPGARVYTVDPDNSAWWVWGTSIATPHAAALLALQLQYARQRGIEINNAYLWEVMKHGAKDLGLDPVWQGSGKIWAAETNEPPPDPHKGSIDLMGSSIWPFDFTFTYYNYLYLLEDKYPAYFLGTTMSQDIAIDNISDEPDIPDTYVENLNITTIQKYRTTGVTLPGDSTEDFETYEPIALNPGDIITLEDDYDLPIYAEPGLYNVVLDLEFNLVGNPRLLKITLNEASIWCPPGPAPSTQSGYGVRR